MNTPCKKLLTTLLISTLTAGCAGHAPNPVLVSRPSDSEMSCRSLMAEMEEIDHNIRKLLPKSEKTGKNVALGVAGAFFLVPWFFMDFSDAEKVEIDAYQSRYNHLTRVYNDKQCSRKKIQEIHIKEQIEEAQRGAKKTKAGG